MNNQLWLLRTYARRNPAFTAFSLLGFLLVLILDSSGFNAPASERLKWLLFAALTLGRGMSLLPTTLAGRQFARLLPGAAAETRRWTFGVAVSAIAIFGVVYVLALGSFAPLWTGLAVIAGCYLAGFNKLLFVAMIMVVLAVPATPVELAVHPAWATLAGFGLAALGLATGLPFAQPWEETQTQTQAQPVSRRGRLRRSFKFLSLITPGRWPARRSPVAHATAAAEFESFGRSTLPGLRNPWLLGAIGALALLGGLITSRLGDARAVAQLILVTLATCTLLMAIVCAFRLRPARMHLVLARRRLWLAMCAASLRTAFLNGAIIGIIGASAAAVCGVTDPHALLRLASTLLAVNLLFFPGMQWAYLHVPVREIADWAKLQQAHGVQWAVLWRELLVMAGGGAGAALVFRFPVAVALLALIAIGTSALVLRRHYLRADLAC